MVPSDLINVRLTQKACNKIQYFTGLPSGYIDLMRKPYITIPCHECDVRIAMLASRFGVDRVCGYEYDPTVRYEDKFCVGDVSLTLSSDGWRRFNNAIGITYGAIDLDNGKVRLPRYGYEDVIWTLIKDFGIAEIDGMTCIPGTAYLSAIKEVADRISVISRTVSTGSVVRITVDGIIRHAVVMGRVDNSFDCMLMNLVVDENKTCSDNAIRLYKGKDVIYSLPVYRDVVEVTRMIIPNVRQRNLYTKNDIVVVGKIINEWTLHLISELYNK